MNNYNLGFGNSVCVRKAFLETYNGELVIFSANKLSKFDYADRLGDPELIEITRKVIKRQTGYEKKHVYLTNGATGAVTIALRAFKQAGALQCHTRKAPWYLRYPSMINAADLVHLDETYYVDKKESVVLLDIPSNPLGITRPTDFHAAPIILDGVYFNKVYMSENFYPRPACDVLAGSYSKLLGLNGIRIGWIATNDDLLAERIKALIIGEYCSLSSASAEILKNILIDFNWEAFEKMAKMNLDYNREEWSKLEKFFGNMSVPKNGMFHYGPIDKKCKKLLEKSGISWTKGSELGTDDNWGRFNLGQDNETIRKAVATVILSDKRPKK